MEIGKRNAAQSSKYRGLIAVPSCLLLLFSTACGAPPHPAEKIVIQSSFEPDVEVNVDNTRKSADINGADRSLPAATPRDWNHLNGDMYFNLFYYGAFSNYSIVADPENPLNHVAKFQVLNVNPSENRGRAQGTFIMNNKTEVYQTHHFKFRQYISNDFQALMGMQPYVEGGRNWTDFFEVWSPVLAADQPHDVSNGAGSFRISFKFLPSNDPTINGGFKWSLVGEDMEYKKSDGQHIWEVTNNQVPVPFGKWCDWDIYVVKGADPKTDKKSPAQVTVKMTPEGGTQQTLFDIHNERTQHSTYPQNGYYQLTPFKNYLGPDTVNYLVSHGKKDISLYFDDFTYSVR